MGSVCNRKLRRLGDHQSMVYVLLLAQTGPDYIALVAGEVKHPRRVIPKAYRATIFRIIAFYVGGAFFVGINAPWNSHSLLSATTKTARSPVSYQKHW